MVGFLSKNQPELFAQSKDVHLPIIALIITEAVNLMSKGSEISEIPNNDNRDSKFYVPLEPRGLTGQGVPLEGRTDPGGKAIEVFIPTGPGERIPSGLSAEEQKLFLKGVEELRELSRLNIGSTPTNALGRLSDEGKLAFGEYIRGKESGPQSPLDRALAASARERFIAHSWFDAGRDLVKESLLRYPELGSSRGFVEDLSSAGLGTDIDVLKTLPPDRRDLVIRWGINEASRGNMGWGADPLSQEAFKKVSDGAPLDDKEMRQVSEKFMTWLEQKGNNKEPAIDRHDPRAEFLLFNGLRTLSNMRESIKTDKISPEQIQRYQDFLEQYESNSGDANQAVALQARVDLLNHLKSLGPGPALTEHMLFETLEKYPQAANDQRFYDAVPDNLKTDRFYKALRASQSEANIRSISRKYNNQPPSGVRLYRWPF